MFIRMSLLFMFLFVEDAEIVNGVSGINNFHPATPTRAFELHCHPHSVDNLRHRKMDDKKVVGKACAKDIEVEERSGRGIRE